MQKELTTLVFLGLNSGLDIYKKEISLLSAAVFGVLWTCVSVYENGISLELFAPFAIGAAFLALSVLSGERLGMGDGILLLALGAALSWQELLETLLRSLLVCGCWSLILVTVRHKSRKAEVPFVPFLLIGYVGGLVL